MCASYSYGKSIGFSRTIKYIFQLSQVVNKKGRRHKKKKTIIIWVKISTYVILLGAVFIYYVNKKTKLENSNLKIINEPSLKAPVYYKSFK